MVDTSQITPIQSNQLDLVTNDCTRSTDTTISSQISNKTSIPDIKQLSYTINTSTQQTLYTSLLYVYIHTFVVDATTVLNESITVPISDILNITTVQGGITNQLYKVSLTDKYQHYSSIHTTPVLVRIFGAGTDKVINRTNESIVVTYLHNNQYSCSIYSRFNNGRVESFLPGTALEPVEMSYTHIQPLIAQQLYTLHHFDLATLLGHTDVAVFNSIERWIDYIHNNAFTDATKQQVFDTLNFEQVVTDYYAYKQMLLKQHSIQPYTIGFSHNDLLSGNVLYDSNSNVAYLIDYEYADYNYYAYDIANHFAEYAGFECNWVNFPTVEQQLNFLQHYAQNTNVDIQQFQKQIQQFALLPHYYWGIWAVVQAHISEVDFDYIHYAHRKLVGGIQQHRKQCFIAFE